MTEQPSGGLAQYVREIRHNKLQAIESHIESMRRDFERSGNPLRALTACVMSMENELWPPLWAHDWVLQGLREYYDKQGIDDDGTPLSMNCLLGLTRGVGRTPLFKEAARKSLQEGVVIRMWILNTRFPHLSIDQIATMEHERLAAKDPSQSRHQFKPYTVETLKQMYSSKGGQDLREKHRGLPLPDLARFLQGYPQSAIPSDLKQPIPDQF